ncbi:hypothetical protein PHLCEN_2v8267 [Hermanssonia centrifuga]|uniref:Uncharacterized protein n=1 Tax=Hermanssonia centrifuga TaxID=98765 RepID=A0A2R6NUQ6_9APHY|nr:hypothetical protein PHLCEN_2v8267 [Hermanssonia centrifuga]
MNKRFMEFLDHPETNTSYPVLACQKVIAVVKGATEEWSDILKRTDEAYLFQCEGRPLLETADGASEALSAWYKKFESDTHKESGEIEDHSHPIERTRALEDFLSPAKVTIMQCTWCSRPSALLKKCKQCGKVKSVFPHRPKNIDINCLITGTATQNARKHTGRRGTNQSALHLWHQFLANDVSS